MVVSKRVHHRCSAHAQLAESMQGKYRSATQGCVNIPAMTAIASTSRGPDRLVSALPSIAQASRWRAHDMHPSPGVPIRPHAGVKAPLTQRVVQNRVRAWTQARSPMKVLVVKPLQPPAFSTPRGNFKEYDADFRRRKGADADQPHRVTHEKLVRSQATW